MPRQRRIEYKGGIYHLINRGNYRSDIFGAEGAKAALLRGLGETAEKLVWRVHAWVIMSNHYHVALETPGGNLVEGMKHWQATFGTRFNRMRDERGHIFQGRYKSLLVQSGERLAALCHYIHLNPVRVGICSVSELADWPWSSMNGLMAPKRRPPWFVAETALSGAGALPDTKPGRRKYVQYLSWLAESDDAQRQLKFSEMTKGWVIGSAEYKKEVLDQQSEVLKNRPGASSGLGPAQEQLWWAHAEALLVKLGKSATDLERDGKSVPWKVALAAVMRTRTTATNRWMSEHLHVGKLHEVSRKLNFWLREPGSALAKR
jgi:putative transposase